MSDTLHYIYGIVAGTDAPAGIENLKGVADAPVSLVPEGNASALVSQLDGDTFAPAVIEQNTGNMDWITPHAIAHDRVVTWASDKGTVVPLPMWTMFGTIEGVKETLRSREAEFSEAFSRISGAREYSVRLYASYADVIKNVGALSGNIAEIESALQSATPGQRYLLQRKLESEKKDEARNVARNIARETYESLSEHSVQSINEPPPQQSRSEGSAILNGVFLVKDDSLQDFRVALTNLVNRYEGSGFKFEFTGPWPPYHFVRGGGNG